jgi:hypothetical protein
MKSCLLLWLPLSLLALPAGISLAQAIPTSPRIKPHQNPQVVNDKRSRTAAQQKIDSQLLSAARLERQKVASIESDVMYDTAGRAAVDISGEVTDNLLEAIRQEGGEVVNSYPQFKSVRAYLKLSSLETIAGLSEVRIISRAARAELSATKSAQEVRHQSQPKPENVNKSRTSRWKASPNKSRRKKRRRHTSQHHSISRFVLPTHGGIVV